MDHPGSSQSVLQGKPILFGTVHGAIGRWYRAIYRYVHKAIGGGMLYIGTYMGVVCYI